MCEGDCNRQFHLECLGLTSLPEGRFICLECKNGEWIRANPLHLHYYCCCVFSLPDCYFFFQAIILVLAVKRRDGRWLAALCQDVVVITMRTVSVNSQAPPAILPEVSAALNTAALPAAWKETCNEPVKVKLLRLLWFFFSFPVQLYSGCCGVCRKCIKS